MLERLRVHGSRALFPAAVLAYALSSTPAHSQPFVDATSGPLAFDQSSYGVAWIDYDGDGDQDLVVGCNGHVRLYRNNGGASFTDMAGAFPPPNYWSGVMAGDFDNDGAIDVVLGGVHRQDPAGTFTQIGSGPGDGNQLSAGPFADYDLDGDLDLYDVPGLIWRNDGGTFVPGPTLPGNHLFSRGAVWGDYDNDGDPDLYLTGNVYRLYRNDAGTFADVTSGPLTGDHTPIDAAWADYDNDEDLDLYLSMAWGGECEPGAASRLLRNDGGGSFADVTSGPLGSGDCASGVTWGDFDNDGDLDLFHARSFNQYELFRNDGGSTFALVPAGASWWAWDVAAADYDRDGDLDLFVTTPPTDGPVPNRLYRNDQANGNHWLSVELEGTVSNRSSIGARVTVVTGALRQMREISGGDARRSMSALPAWFGLGASDTCDSLIIRWPSGAVRSFASVPADQELRIREGSGSVADVTLAPPADVELAIGPNPGRDATWIRFTLREAAPIRIDLLDVAGRRVAELMSGTRDAGAHELRLERGALSTGIYWVSLDAGGRRSLCKLAILR